MDSVYTEKRVGETAEGERTMRLGIHLVTNGAKNERAFGTL